MDKMTLKERAERKSIWLARATSHLDTPEVRKEAEEMFDRANPIEKCTDYEKK